MQPSARVAILGSGGMGKTTLALAALHSSDVERKYEHRYFVSCESANSASDLISSVGSHLGLEQSKQLSKIIFRHFLGRGPAVLVLDNMETPWEPGSTRAKVEEFLSLLADVPQLALIVSFAISSSADGTYLHQITMRGAERPGKVKWTRPFLPPLEPISPVASRQTFIDIAEEPGADEEAALAELMELTGNLPLAVILMANVVSFEGYLGALARWNTENTALLSEGYDKRSNLEKSINMSLTSPRIKSNPSSLGLLGLLSLLPDGISERELVSSNVPLPSIAECRSSLLQTCLAFIVDGRLKVLAPIRDYIRRTHPPSPALTKPLRMHFQGLLGVWDSYYGLSPADIVPQLTSQLGNIYTLLQNTLTTEGVGKPDVGHAILTFNYLSIMMRRGASPLNEQLPAIIEATQDQRLKWMYIRCCVDGNDGSPASPADLDRLMNQGIQYFVAENDYEGQGTRVLI
jgi:hypothetical protein